jgi:hypothetical protein
MHFIVIDSRARATAAFEHPEDAAVLLAAGRHDCLAIYVPAQGEDAAYTVWSRGKDGETVDPAESFDHFADFVYERAREVLNRRLQEVDAKREALFAKGASLRAQRDSLPAPNVDD